MKRRRTRVTQIRVFWHFLIIIFADLLGDVEIVDIRNLSKSGTSDADIIDSGRPSSINSGDKTLTTLDSEDDFSTKSFKDGYEVVSGEVSIVQDTDDESNGLRNAVINDLAEHVTDIPNLAFKIESTESKKSFNEIVKNSVKEKIPYFESLGDKPFSNVLDNHPGNEKDESQLKSIDENIDSLEFDNIETLELSSSDPPCLVATSPVSDEKIEVKQIKQINMIDRSLSILSPEEDKIQENALSKSAAAALMRQQRIDRPISATSGKEHTSGPEIVITNEIKDRPLSASSESSKLGRPISAASSSGKGEKKDKPESNN